MKILKILFAILITLLPGSSIVSAGDFNWFIPPTNSEPKMPSGDDEHFGGYYMTDEPVFRFPERKMYSTKRTPSSYAKDPTSDIDWSSGMSGVSDVQASFNSARQMENSQLGTSIPMLTLPPQSEWDIMTDNEKALWLINRERVDRGIHPLHGLEENVTFVAQYYAQYLIDNNAWGHYEDGNSPWERLEANQAIGACHDFLNVSENLAVFWTSGSSIPLPIERSIFNWMYDDGNCCSWGHRHAILWYPYNDNSGTSGPEGFLGIGRASGSHYGWNFGEIIVMNVFDPCSEWEYGSVQPELPTVTTASINGITETGAEAGGNVISDGGGSVTAKGVCWSTSQNPTTTNDKTIDGSGLGSFASTISGLSPNTRYYIKAYATNSVGTSYGNEYSFTTSDPKDSESEPPILKGDISYDGVIDINDLVLALQVVSCIESTREVYRQADINGEGRIGLEELIYILQKASGLR